MNILLNFQRGLLIAIFLAASCWQTANAATDSKKKVADDSSVVAVFKLSGGISDTPEEGDFQQMLSGKQNLNLKDLVERLKKAQDDKKVKAVVFVLDSFSIGMAQLEELHRSIAQLRESGKEVYAHANSLTMGEYVLFSGVNKLSVVPTGEVEVAGLHSESPYIRGLLDKLGVVPDFLTCGTYKSAAEMFTRESPSAESEEMSNWLNDSMFESMVKMIAKGRAMEPEKIRKCINEGPYTATKAHAAGLIDAVQHKDEFASGIKQRFDNKVVFDHKYAEKPAQKVEFSLLDFSSIFSPSKKSKSKKDSITIINVQGEITLGSERAGMFGSSGHSAASTPICKVLNDAAMDDSVKAVVLRIDSPGGSATASEIILQATKQLKAKKPIVVSMGNVAASGGYYIATSSDTIFADDLTITGSIGVVGGKMVTTELWKKVGVNWKEHSRGNNASLNSTATTFNTDQRKLVQSSMDEVYGVFKNHVTEIRGKRLKKPIDDIAGGRVYSGHQALELGLVDKIGTLDDAVKFAAEQAKLEKYEVRILPESKNVFESLFGGDTEEEPSSKSLDLRSSFAQTRAGDPLLQAVLPHLQNLDPHRTESVMRAFHQLEILRQEGVVLMTPEFIFDSCSR